MVDIYTMKRKGGNLIRVGSFFINEESDEDINEGVTWD
jgi:hypothetical protein